MNEKWLGKIGQYLNEQMSYPEQLQFKTRVSTNEELALLLQRYNAVETEMRNLEKNRAQEAGLKDTLEKLNAFYFDNKEETQPDTMPVANQEGNSSNDAIPEYIPTTPRLSAVHNVKVGKMTRWRLMIAAAAILGIVALKFLCYFTSKQSRRQVAVKKMIKELQQITRRKQRTAILPLTAHVYG